MASTIFSTPASAEIIPFPAARIVRPHRLVSALIGAENCAIMMMSSDPILRHCGKQAFAENEAIIASYSAKRPGHDLAGGLI